MPVVEPISINATNLTISQFADGDGWSTQFVLVNPTDAQLRGDVRWLDAQGRDVAVTVAGTPCPGGCAGSQPYTLAPRGSLTLVSNGAGSLKTGRIVILPAVNGVAPAATAVFAAKTNGITVSQSSVQAQVPQRSFRLYARSASSIRIGVAISGLTGTATDVQLTLTDLSGVAKGVSTVSLTANQNYTAFFLDELPAFRNLGDFAGAGTYQRHMLFHRGRS